MASLRMKPFDRHRRATLQLRANLPPIQQTGLRSVLAHDKNQADAEDLTQEAFLQVFRKIHTFRGESTFFSWFHRLSVNIVLMSLRKRKIMEIPLENDWRPPGRARRAAPGTWWPRPSLTGLFDRENLKRALHQMPSGLQTNVSPARCVRVRTHRDCRSPGMLGWKFQVAIAQSSRADAYFAMRSHGDRDRGSMNRLIAGVLLQKKAGKALASIRHGLRVVSVGLTDGRCGLDWVLIPLAPDLTRTPTCSLVRLLMCASGWLCL